MAEAGQLELVVGILGLVDVLLHVAAVGGDPLQGADDGLVGAAMQRTPQGGDPGADRRIEVHLTAPHQSHRRGRAVLLVIRVEDQQQVERFGDVWVDLIGLGGHREHHVQQVRGVVQVVAGIDVGLADRLLE